MVFKRTCQKQAGGRRAGAPLPAPPVQVASLCALPANRAAVWRTAAGKAAAHPSQPGHRQGGHLWDSTKARLSWTMRLVEVAGKTSTAGCGLGRCPLGASTAASRAPATACSDVGGLTAAAGKLAARARRPAAAGTAVLLLQAAGGAAASCTVLLLRQAAIGATVRRGRGEGGDQ